MTSTTDESERVRWWVEQYRVHMRRASADDTTHVRNRMQHPPEKNRSSATLTIKWRKCELDSPDCWVIFWKEG